MNWIMDPRLLLLILFYLGRAQLRPAKSLEQSPEKIAWTSLLLENNNRTEGAEETNRRITPKSIFTVRPFSPELLPPCAEGYRSDPMGRCISYVKFDQHSHLGFLVEKLNAMYDEDDYVDEEEETDKPTAGPLQFNIPFGETAEEDNEKPIESTGVAVVAAPTNGNFNVADTDKNQHTDPETVKNTTVEHKNITTVSLTKEMLFNLTNHPDGIQPNVEQNETIISLIKDLLDADILGAESNYSIPDTKTALNILHHKHLQDREASHPKDEATTTIEIETEPTLNIEDENTTNHSETNLTKYESNITDTEEGFNKTQALFFLLNITDDANMNTSNADDLKYNNTENFYEATENVTISKDHVLINPSNVIDLNNTNSNDNQSLTKLDLNSSSPNQQNEKPFVTPTLPPASESGPSQLKEDFLPIPADDELKIDRFLSSYVHFPDETSSGNFKTTFFKSQLSDLRFPNDRKTSTRTSTTATSKSPNSQEKLQAAESIKTDYTSVNNKQKEEKTTEIILSDPSNKDSTKYFGNLGQSPETPYQNYNYGTKRPVKFPTDTTIKARPTTVQISEDRPATVSQNNHQTITFPEYSHRNRDRNLFSWLDQNPSTTQQHLSTSTPHRTSYKYYAPSSSYIRPNVQYPAYNRKIVSRDFDRLFRTRQWNNR